MNGDESPEDRHQRERIGVSGDPVPDHEYGDDRDDLHPDEAPPWVHRVTGDVARRVDALTDAGLLTERQALAYVLREVVGVHRDDAAADMGVSTSTLDTHLANAKQKVQQARETVALLDRTEE